MQRRESTAEFIARRDSVAPPSRKNSSFQPQPSQSRLFDSFTSTKRHAQTDTASLAGMDPDAVFEKHSVAEVRTMLARTSVDIERKKQDLRVMVGERYRDLIDAADAIKTMSTAAHDVDATFLAMRNGCDAQSIKRKVMESKAKGSAPGDEKRKTSVYSVAAQIKVLVNTPEQIWHAMEEHKYLRACRLYLVARQVYENLTTTDDAASLRSLHSFPVVKRQWNAVSHFRDQIVERSVSHLSSTGEDSQNISETLCAIILLTGASQHDILKRFLATRHSTFVTHIKASTPQTPAEIASRICSLLESIRRTLHDIQQIFFLESSPSLLTKTVSQLTAPPAAQSHSISEIYREKTNMHLIYRHLPASIAAHRPRVDPVNTRAVSPEVARKDIDAWEREVRNSVTSAATVWLGVVEKATILSTIRNHVLHSVKEGERGESASQYPALCSQVFGKHYSLWTDLIRAPFNEVAEAVLARSFEGLATQPEAMIKDMLINLSNVSQPDRHVAEYMWSAENFAAGSIDLEDSAAVVYRGETPALASLGSSFEKIVRDVKDDASPLFETTAEEADDGHLALTDSVRLFDAFRTILGAALVRYREGLMELLSVAQEAGIIGSDGEDNVVRKAETVDKCLFAGRVGRSVALRVQRLGALLGLDRPRTPQWEASLEAFAKDIETWERSLLDVYDAAHRVWIDVIARRMEGAVASEVARVTWANSEFTALWEGGVPVQPSPFVMTTLFDLCREWNRVAGFTLEKNILTSLMAETHSRIAHLYSTIIPTAPHEDAVKQLAFDQAYFGTVLAPGDTSRGNLIEQRIYDAVIPNVTEFWKGSGTLFGAFLISHAAPAAGPSSKSTSEMYNIIPLTKPPPRFTLLPVPTAPKKHLPKQHSHSSMDGSNSNPSQQQQAPNTPPRPQSQRRVSLIPDPPAKQPRAPAAQEKFVRGAKPPAISLHSRPPPVPPKQQYQQSAAPLPQGLGKTFEVFTSGARNVLSGVLDYTSQVGSPVIGRRGKGPGG
ncbi:hypothetical protein PhCBS80983_g02491 [Powellomyces hirtus]|uniref:Conserved oligomeric Golgi complex subunit 1 n=1 Tax=Powellomyces hirtus TaxID=109895 RepID=A0A507E7M6_9FUNG|nr:hypothetical protein PhCBS80983_g02491 [Powellomyces hirtus]